jgi:hypothetical protein
VEAVSKCLAFSGYKAREDERAWGEGKSDEREKKKKLGAEPRIGRRKQRKKKLKKKTERNQRELTFNRQNVMLLLPSPFS